MRQPQCSKEEEGRDLHGAKCVVARAVKRAQRAATAWDVALCEGKPAAQRRETEVKGDEVREEAGDRVEGASPADMIKFLTLTMSRVTTNKITLYYTPYKIL